jgi:hypothetical protein
MALHVIDGTSGAQGKPATNPVMTAQLCDSERYSASTNPMFHGEERQGAVHERGEMTRASWPTRRWVVLISALFGLVACVAITINSQVASAQSRLARTAGAVSVNDTGHLHFLRASGSLLLEEGSVSGTLPGNAKVHLVVSSTVSATFTIEAHGGGTITGRGTATLHSSGIYSSFGGSLSVSHGTGRYAHAHGSGKLYGLINRRTHALTVQTTGTLHY